jgi:hypothetical protein
MARYIQPLDPECVVVGSYIKQLMDDPMTKAMNAPVDDIMAEFKRKHFLTCERCQRYGAANIYVDENLR